MKAIVYAKYGPPQDVLKLEEVQKPAPSDNEVLIEVHAASVNYVDGVRITGMFLARLMALAMGVSFGFLKPKHKIPGTDMAGRVEATGRNVTQFQPGDEVFGSGYGAFAEYVCAPEKALALKPANISFEEAAAAVQAPIVALQGLRDQGHLQPMQKVLIYGASGGIGTFAVQIAKSFGADVTGVCSTRNLDMVRSIGADHVIDYTREDFTKSGQRYDLILATAGYRSILDYKRALSPKGIYVVTGGSMSQIFQAMILGPLISKTGNKKVRSFIARIDQKDLVFIKELLEASKIKPVIDTRYPLSEVAEALQHYAERHARGKVVITLEPNSA